MPLDETTFKRIEEQMVSFFTTPTLRADSVEVSAAELVTLQMSTHFEVTAITLHGLDLSPEDTRRLEQALQTAFNDAIREVIRRNGEQFQQIVQLVQKSQP